MRVSVIGLGYIGLPTAAVAASAGYEVVGVDVNPQTVATINDGKIHIVEPDLDELVKRVVTAGQLLATTEPVSADIYVIAVPTPIQTDKTADLSFVVNAAKSIAPTLKSGSLVILESTSPVGTTEKVADILAKARPDLSFPEKTGEKADVQLAYCPERVLPGNVLTELRLNDRVIGGMTMRAGQMAKAFYQKFVTGQCIVTSARTAEMVKLTENSYRDVNIAFANELSFICAEHDINVYELIDLANHHPRVNILTPGVGVGGHCIAVDPWFVVESAPRQAKMIKLAREINDAKPAWIVEQIEQALKDVKSPVIACLGLSFKPNIDDLRGSPALQIVKMLAQQQLGQLLVVEPHINELPEALDAYDSVSLVDIDEALKAGNCVVALVNHQAFSKLELQSLGDQVLIDARGVVKQVEEAV